MADEKKVLEKQRNILKEQTSIVEKMKQRCLEEKEKFKKLRLVENEKQNKIL